MSRFEYTIGKDVNLKEEWEKTLKDEGLHSNLILRGLYLVMNLLYGKERKLDKFLVIEILARYPYMAWEVGSYLRLTRLYAGFEYTRKSSTDDAWKHINMGRVAQDNEQWHMFIIEDLMRQRGMKRNWLMHAVLPRFMALGYYFMTRIMYRIKPEWSFDMNARFESHAEREYAKAIVDHPEREEEEIDTAYFE